MFPFVYSALPCRLLELSFAVGKKKKEIHANHQSEDVCIHERLDYTPITTMFCS